MQAALSAGFLIPPTSSHLTVAEMEAEGLWKLEDPWLGLLCAPSGFQLPRRNACEGKEMAR